MRSGATGKEEHVAALEKPDASGVEVYEFRVKGELGAAWSEWFDGLQVSAEGGETLLCGQLRDQAALYGLIAKFRNLGLALVSINIRRVAA
jgi:hypothetical protein